jgi:cephalosporin hydroxylase
MKLTIDTVANRLTQEMNGQEKILDLYTREAFQLISQQWINVGWNQKYSYTFTWMGRPIIQLPEDMVRIQEVIYKLKPDIIIETGIAHGGSLIYYASLCRLNGKGRVIGVDIEIRPHNLEAIKVHEMSSYITLIEGDSTDADVVRRVKSLIKPGDQVMVILDSCHTKPHVLGELEAYHDLVTPGSYLVATDGVMKNLHNVPRGQPKWSWDNPADAAVEFVQDHPEFILSQPAWPFNESSLTENVTHWPGAWLLRKAD